MMEVYNKFLDFVNKILIYIVNYMSMLSFTRGKPIARIEGGEHGGKTLYLFDPDKKEEVKNCCNKCNDSCIKKKKKCCKDCSKGLNGGCGSCCKEGAGIGIEPYKFINDNFILSRKRNIKGGAQISMKDMEDLLVSIITNKMPENKNLEGIYKKGVDLLEAKKNNEIILADGKMVPLPNNVKTDEGERICVSGPSGSGKSTYAHNFIEEIRKMFPEMKDLFVFCRSEKDKALDDLNPMRFKIDQSLVNEPIQTEQLSNSIVLFDDVDAIRDKKIKDAVLGLRDDILQNGRKQNIFCICTSHQLTNYKSSRELLNECQSVTFFPKSGSLYGIKYFLKVYCGLDKGEIDKIVKLPSRWVTIVKRYPNYIIYESGCYLLGEKQKTKKEQKEELEDKLDKLENNE